VPDVRAQASRLALLGTGVLALRKDDVILAAFPRSGSTWTRHVLCNLISLNEWGGEDVEPLLDRTMPALGANDLFRPWPHRTMPRVVKTHHRYSPLFRSIPSVGLVRDPRDVMVSRYHLLVDKRKESGEPFGQFIRDPRHGLEGWFRHYVSWRDRWRLALRYEDMLADPEEAFGRLLDALGATWTEDALREAILRSSFTSLQRAEKRRKPSAEGHGLFFRSGSAGQWREYFDAADLDYHDALAARYDVSVYATDPP
jgi:hypothetical protein